MKSIAKMGIFIAGGLIIYRMFLANTVRSMLKI